MLTKWGDKNITYDAIGNPVVFDDLTMTWQGRQLETLSMGSMSFAYDYNADGQRISKTFTDSESSDTYTTEYFYNGSILAGEKTGSNTIVYMYDNNGDLFGFTYNGTEYYYIKNAQNDVTAVADANGNVIVRYYYIQGGRSPVLTKIQLNITMRPWKKFQGLFCIKVKKNALFCAVWYQKLCSLVTRVDFFVVVIKNI